MTLMASTQTRLALVGTLSLLMCGTALAEERTFSNLGDFTAVDASAGVTVDVSALDSHSVVAEAEKASDFDHLEISVVDGKLVITRDHNLLDFILEGGLVGALFGTSGDLIVHVSMPELQNANASSGANMSVAGFAVASLNGSSSSGASLALHNISADTLNLSASSGANLSATGTCGDIQASSSSGADLNAEGLMCQTGDLNASRGSDLTANLSGSVEIDVSSGADITILGNPTATSLNQSSGGSISLQD